MAPVMQPVQPRRSKWTKQRAAAAAANRSTHAPARKLGVSADLTRMHLRSTIGPCFEQSSASYWPATKPWPPQPDAAARSAGVAPLHRTFDFRLHDPKGSVKPHTVLVHNATKGDRVRDTVLSAHGLLPGGNAAAQHAASGGARSGRDPAKLAFHSSELGRRSDPLSLLVGELAQARLVEPPFQLGWKIPERRAKVEVDLRSREEWKLQSNEYDPLITFQLHQHKVNEWRAEALAKPQPIVELKPPLQPLPKAKHVQYMEMREQFGDLLKPASSWIRAREWEQQHRAASETAALNSAKAAAKIEGF
ncbi:hypothetical protein T492DRAFT_840439 [Pavlovales sp. CCMP2436]|nr:hypothetical protein T492DRAFT_840439 [Pavlovales sp. CCMP2436]